MYYKLLCKLFEQINEKMWEWRVDSENELDFSCGKIEIWDTEI